MADPLTSSDVWRIERGFGASPMASPEERRRFAGAGQLPLSSENIARLAEGLGISPMAGAAEKEAWKMAEYMAGRREQAPVEYGGIGERPIGTSRRAIRMQAAWDEERKRQMEEMKFARDVELGNREIDLRERSFYLQQQQEARLQAAQAKNQELEYRTSEQASAAMGEIMGGVDAQGNQISALDPDDPNYMQRRNDIIKRYPRAMYDDAFKSALASTDKSYFDMLNFQQQQQLQEESAGRVAERQEATATRGEKERMAIREEERVAAEERDIKKKESDIDKQIREQRQVIVGSQGQTVTKTQQNQIAQARNKLLDLRIERADLRGLYFEDQEAYKQAIDAGKKPPAGTTIYIGRKQVKVK